MNAWIRRVLFVLLGAVLCPEFPAQAGSVETAGLGFSERLACRLDVEAVYWRHRLWPEQNPGPKPPLEAVLPQAELVSMVEASIRKSNALERYWNRAITREQLRGEIDRMARDTRSPEMLAELWAALGNDAFLVEECLARPILADRLIRESFAARTPAGTDRDKSSFEAWWSEVEDELPTELESSAASTSSPAALPQVPGATCTPDTWRAMAFDPVAASEHDAVWTGSEMLVWGVDLFNSSKPGARYDPATDTWHPIRTTGQPAPRTSGTAVWTGTEMIIWGGWAGSNGSNVLSSGGRYNPQTDSWTPTGIGLGLPQARMEHSAVWTGSVMVVFGGCDAFACMPPLNSGGRYDPVTDSWQPTSVTGAPIARWSHAAVWTGSRMVVWGGAPVSNVGPTGGRYDPLGDTWQPTATLNAPAARSLHSGVWSGSRLIVWGGCDANGCFAPLNSGGRYDPVADVWQTVAVANAPLARRRHSAAWGGGRMIIWGGCVDHDCSSHRRDGGRYDPVANTWSPTSTSGAPMARSSASAVWSGSEMIVWGGCNGGECQIDLNSGGRYDPQANSWRPTTLANAPSARVNHTAVWTGAELIVWGSENIISNYTGGRYDPATDRWAGVNVLGSPTGRDLHTAVWTGTEMIVWGGRVTGIGAHNSGGRYNPTTDQWVDTTFTGAPASRQSHTAVWTGSEMTVWGGCTDSFCMNVFADGGRYRPSSDTWSPVSTTGAPAGTWFNSSVWTSAEMIVWGGRLAGGSPTNTGGRYNPALDSWALTSVSGAPTAREGHVAAWTGSEMVVWGGQGGGGTRNDGARYDPNANAWTPVASAGAPAARSRHTAVWTGSEMVVWGGCSSPACGAFLASGGRYSPADDQWAPTGTGAFTPSERYLHTAVWSGSEMLVWGGWQGSGSTTLHTGANYCPGPGGSPPNAPTNLTAVAKQTRVRLHWVDNSNDEDNFVVERCRGGDCTAFVVVVILGANTTSYIDNNLARLTVYRYRVKARNGFGDSGYSNIVRVRTK